jgi:tetratricopeptide (TPR) repeat protein
MSLVLEHTSTQPSMPPPPPLENVVLASSRANAQPETPPSGTIDRDAFVRTYREAMVYFNHGDWDRAEEALKRVLDIWANSELYVLLGYTYFFRGDFTRASNYFLKATNKNQNDVSAHLSLALAYNRLGKTEKAISAVWDAIRLRHDSADAHFLLGNLRHQLHQWDLAEEAYRKALQLRNDFPEVYQYLALMYFEIGNSNGAEREDRYREAIATYQELIDINPASWASYINIGYIYDQLGEHEEATEAYQKAVQFALPSDDFPGIVTLGMELLDAARRFNEARSVFKRALEVIGESHHRDGISRVQILTWIGTSDLQSVDSLMSNTTDPDLLGEAEESFREALTLDPNYIHAQLGLGAVYYSQGRIDEAIQAFKKALEIDPDNHPARGNIEFLVEERLKQRLFEKGLLKQIKDPITDFTPYQNRTPILVHGKPVSETIVEDRR